MNSQLPEPSPNDPPRPPQPDESRTIRIIMGKHGYCKLACDHEDCADVEMVGVEAMRALQSRVTVLEEALQKPLSILAQHRPSLTGLWCGHKAGHGHPVDWELTLDAKRVASDMASFECGFLSACANAIVELDAILTPAAPKEQP